MVADEFDTARMIRKHGWNSFSSEDPIEGCPKIEHIRAGIKRFTFDLFRCDEVRCTLNPLFDRSNPTALTKINNLNRTIISDDDIIGLDIGMDVSLGMHIGQGICNSMEDAYSLENIARWISLTALSPAEFHQEQQLLGFEEVSDTSKLIVLTNGRMVELPSDFVFVDCLLEESFVIPCLFEDAFQGKVLTRSLMPYTPDRTPRTATKILDNVKSWKTKRCLFVNHGATAVLLVSGGFGNIRLEKIDQLHQDYPDVPLPRRDRMVSGRAPEVFGLTLSGRSFALK